MEKSVKKIFKICAFAGIFIFGSEFLFSQESLDSVYAQIDLAFVEQSPENISKVLEKYSSSKDYYLYEAYTLKKARQYVVEDNLEFARDATLAVIDNNLENFDAVDLYSYIDRAILSEEAARRAEENRLRMEAERLAVLNERTKAKIAKSDTYSSVNTASGTSIYINQGKDGHHINAVALLDLAGDLRLVGVLLCIKLLHCLFSPFHQVVLPAPLPSRARIHVFLSPAFQRF